MLGEQLADPDMVPSELSGIIDPVEFACVVRDLNAASVQGYIPPGMLKRWLYAGVPAPVDG